MTKSIAIAGKYLRDNRWDILGRAIQVLEGQTSFELSEVLSELIRYGAVWVDSPKGPRLQTSSLPDCKEMTINVLDNGQISLDFA